MPLCQWFLRRPPQVELELHGLSLVAKVRQGQLRGELLIARSQWSESKRV